MMTEAPPGIKKGAIYTRTELADLGFGYHHGFGFGADAGEVFRGEAGELRLKPLDQFSDIHFDKQRFKVIRYKCK